MFAEFMVKELPAVILTEVMPIVPAFPSFVTKTFEVADSRVSATIASPPTRVV